VPSPLQFLVERVQIDVGQQWRQYSPNVKDNLNSSG
jgi:hypothetical protein